MSFKNNLIAAVSEPMNFTYEHSKGNWVMMNIVYAIPVIALLWIIGSCIIQDYLTFTEIFQYFWSVFVAFGMAAMMAGWLLNQTKKEVENKKRTEHPCPRCKGTGWIIKEKKK